MVKIDFTRLLIAERNAEERVEKAKKRAEEIIRKAEEKAEEIIEMKSKIDYEKIKEEVRKIPYRELEIFREDLRKKLRDFNKFVEENRNNICEVIVMYTLGVKV